MEINQSKSNLKVGMAQKIIFQGFPTQWLAKSDDLDWSNAGVRECHLEHVAQTCVDIKLSRALQFKMAQTSFRKSKIGEVQCTIA